MLAIMEPTNNTQVSLPEPTVIYDLTKPLDKNSALTIRANVIVYPPTIAGDQPIIETPMITIPGRPENCVVIWTLVDGSDSNLHFTRLEFSNDEQPGIVIPSANQPHMPDAIVILSSSVVDGVPNQWRVEVKNNVISANSFSYSIFVLYDLGNGPSNIIHDPTIAVVPDPMG